MGIIYYEPKLKNHPEPKLNASYWSTTYLQRQIELELQLKTIETLTFYSSIISNVTRIVSNR